MKMSRPKRPSAANAKSSEAREAINTVSASVSTFMNEAYIAIMGNLSVTDNLNMNFVTVSANISSDGIPSKSIKFKTGLKSKAAMILCGRVYNALPTGGVMVSFIENSGVIEITHLTGLTADTDYQLTLVLIGI